MSEFKTDNAIADGDFSGAVLDVEMAEREACLCVVHLLQAGSLFEDGFVQFFIVVWNGAPRDADPAAVFFFGDADEFHVRVDENLAVGILLFADVEVDAVVMLQEDADGADTRLVFVGGREEIGAGFFEEVGDFVDGIDFLVAFRLEFTAASRS